MQPIQLKIKGLNSFKEEQVISFEALTKQGLFGIFGPTGSGKSTILDGITLALYGEVARGVVSKNSNFINSSSNTASVSFQFRMNGQETHEYCAERSYRINKSGKRKLTCRLVEIKPGEESILLSESDKEMKAMCQSIIGLKYDDFIRTVVLPQGQFSKFLTLEGSKRNEMLERLFHLDEYGELLMNKVKKEADKTKAELNQFEGELKAYEAVSQEEYLAQRAQWNDLQQELERLEKQKQELEDSFVKLQEIWNLQQEQQEYVRQQQQLDLRRPEMHDCCQKLTRANSAQMILPLIKQWQETLSQLNEIKQAFRDAKDSYEEVSQLCQKAEEELERTQLQEKEQMPKLQEQLQHIQEAMQKQSSYEKLDEEYKKIKKQEQQYQKKRETIQKEYDDLQTQLSLQLEQKTRLTEQLEFCTVDRTYRNLVQSAAILEQNLQELKQSFLQREEKYQRLYGQYEDGKISCEEKQRKLDELVREIEIEKNLLEKQVEPYTQQEIDTKIEEQNVRKQVYQQQENLKQIIQDILVEQQKTGAILQQSNQKQEKIALEKEQIQEQIVQVQAKLNELEQRERIWQQESLAESLRAKLAEGDTCPVCGGIIHFSSVIGIPKEIQERHAHFGEEREHYYGILDGLQSEKSDLETAYYEEKAFSNALQSKVQELTDRLAEQQSEQTILYRQFGEVREEEIITLEEQIRQMKEEKISYEQSYAQEEKRLQEKRLLQVQLQAQMSADDSKMKQFILQCEELKEEQDKLQLRVEEMEKSLAKKIEEWDRMHQEWLNYSGYLNGKKVIFFEEKNFVNNLVQIENCEREFELCQAQLEQSQDEIKNQQVRQQRKLEDRQKLDLELVKFGEKKDNMEKQLEILRSDLFQLVGEGRNLEKYQSQVEQLIQKLQHKLQQEEKSWKNLQRQEQQAQENVIKQETSLISLQNQELQQQKLVMEQCKLFSFETVEAVTASYLPDDTKQTYQKAWESYQEACQQNQADLARVCRQLNQRSISEQEWNKVQEKRMLVNDKWKEQTSLETKFHFRIQKMETDLARKKQLEKQQQQQNHRASLLKDLESIFKGKQFVEFIAAERLNYIAREASKRLSEITSGQYELETGSNGEFLIVDNKNGGVKRHPSTLSGGETFVTSLALALALSSQIQLSHNTSLELFFLDEGFGSLDEDLLNVVMDALEHVHHEHLKVGIISHVESVKQRVPVKLIVTPVQMGGMGSQVKLEIS